MKRPLPTWHIPIAGDHGFVLKLVDSGAIAVSRPVFVGGRQAATIRVGTFSPLEACHLGMALTEASGVAGQLTARRKR